MESGSTAKKIVYLVIESWDYEGSTVLSVYLNGETAEIEAAKLRKGTRGRNPYYEVEQMEIQDS